MPKNKRIKLDVLSAIPASGKTKAILTNIEKSDFVIIASLSRQLSTQSYNYYIDEVLKGDKSNNSVILIDSENTLGYSNVNEAITKIISIKPAEENTGKIIFITHAALFELSLSEIKGLNKFDLFIDEVPELVEFNRYSFTKSLDDSLLKYCEPVNRKQVGFQNLILADEHRETVEALAYDGYCGLDDIYSKMFGLYKALLNQIPVMVQFLKDQTYCFFINDKTSNDWAKFKSITVAASNFAKSFTGQVLKNLNGWDLQPSKLQKHLEFNHYDNTNRITIYTLLDGVDWSKHVSERNIGTGEDRDTVYNKMKSIVEEELKDNKFIYTGNSYRSRLIYGHDVPYNPHGLNYYTNYTNAAILFSYNPLPWQIPLMKSLSSNAGLDENTLLNSYIISKYLEPAFQLCARTNIRDNNSEKEIVLFVPDLKLAEYIKRNYFIHAKIDTSKAISLESNRSKPRNRISFQNIFGMSKRESYRFAYFRRKNELFLDPKNEKDIEIVKKWIEEEREK